MKKILFIHHSTNWGGAPINIINIINGLNKNEYEPVFFLLKECPLVDYLEDNDIKYQIAESKFYHKFYKTFSHLETSKKSWYRIINHLQVFISWILSRYLFAPRELKKLDYDIYHLNSSVLSDWLRPCQNKGKVVYHIQETILDKGFSYYFLKKQVSKYADRIVAISKHTAEKMNLPGLTTIVYNFTEFATEPPPKESYKSKQVLYVGGQSEIKGFYTVVDALKYLDDDINVVFAGRYRKESSKNRIKLISKSYRRKWKYLSIIKESKNSHIAGLVPDIQPLLEQTVCLVSPFSSPHFSRPIIEAYANFKPVITTRIEGIEEVVNTDNQPTGYIIKNNPKDLAKAINKICKEPEKAYKMGKGAYNVARSQFSTDNVRVIEEVYETICN